MIDHRRLVTSLAVVAILLVATGGCGGSSSSEVSSSTDERRTKEATTTSGETPSTVSDPIEEGALVGDPTAVVAFDDPSSEISTPVDLRDYLLPGLAGTGAACVADTIDVDDVLGAAPERGAELVAESIDACVRNDSIGTIVAMYATMLGEDAATRYDALTGCVVDEFAALDDADRTDVLEKIYAARLDLAAPPTSPAVAADAIRELTSCSADDSGTARTSTTAAGGGGSRLVPWAETSPGDCVSQFPVTETFTSVEVVDCDEPHAGEAIANTRLPASDVALRGPDSAASGACTAAFSSYSGRAIVGSGYELLWLVAAPRTTPGSIPRPGDLAQQYTVVCFAQKPGGGPAEGSLRG